MQNLSEIKNILLTHKVQIQAKYHIKRIGIFGSVARGEATPVSDIDLLVEFEKPIGLDFVILADELEQILKMKVDLVTPNAIKPRLLKYIQQELIYV